MTPSNTCVNPPAARESMYQRFLQWIADGEVKPRPESRSYLRVKMPFEGWLSGPSGTFQLRGIDLHHAGVGVRMWRRMTAATLVFLQLQTFQQMGFAYVRHCIRRGLGYRIGLEFRSPLMRQDVGSWAFQHVKEAAGSLKEWEQLTGQL